MILYICSAIMFLFISFNLFFRAHCGIVWKCLGILLIFLISAKYELYELLGGAFFSPALPRAFLLIMECLYGALIILFFLLLLWDIYLAGNWILAKAGFPTPAHLPKGAIKCGLVALALALGAFGVWQAVKTPSVKTVEMPLAKLPQALDGFVIVQLSDLHIGPLLDGAWLRHVVEETNRQEADVIALTGDYVDGTVAELGKELAPLADLKAKYGVFGVTGNHEYYWNAAEWKKALANLNIDMLENEHRVIEVNNEKIVIAGIPDLVAARFNHPAPDIRAALGNAPEAVRILLAHQPKNAREYSAHADLHLAGHTHGGLMFFLQPLIARFNNGFVQGLYPVNASSIYVSPGTGLWNGFSNRIGVPAEITRIVLRAG